MGALLFIPWFRAEPLLIPYPESFPPIQGYGHNLPIQPFGVLVAIGVLVGYQVAEKRAKHVGIHPTVYADLAFHCMVGGFIGGHVLDSLFYHWPEVVRDPVSLIKLWAGLSSFGGFTGAVIGSAVWKYRRKLSFLAVGDTVIYGFPFAWIFGRSGCFVVHDHPGAVTTFPLAVADYHVGNPPFQTRHDLGFYEILFCVVFLPVLVWLWNKKLPRGFFLGFIPVCYAPVRFFLDFLRATPAELGDDADPRILGLTPGHYAAIALFLVGVAVLYYVFKYPVPELPPEARWDAEAERLAAEAEKAEAEKPVKKASKRAKAKK